MASILDAAGLPKLKNAPASFRSPVWRYFGFRLDDNNNSTSKNYTTCKICFSEVSYKAGNTSNMATHLKRKHSISETNQPVKEKSEQPTISKLLTNSLQFNQNNPKSKTITNAIAYFIACDMRPFSVVENPGFQHLLHVGEPRYKIPSRPHFSQTVIPGLYEKVRSRISTEIKAAEFIALTTDSWTSRAVENYVTFTSHFIDENWVVQNSVLQTRQVSESHTAENLAKGLLDCVDEWGLNKNGIGPAVSTDNASNIVKAVKEANLSPHVGCFAHTINLAVQKGVKVPQLDRLLGRIRRVVSFFHKSTTASHIFKSTQKKLELKDEKLLIDVQTRWNSTLDMISRYLEQQPAIFSTLTSKEVKQNVKDIVTLSNEDVKLAEEMVDVLRPFKTVTNIMCDAKHPTVSVIFPMKEQLMTSLSVKDTDTQLLINVKEAMAADLSPRYSSPKVKEFLLMSSVTDPRFKSLPHLTEENRDEVYNSLTIKSSSLHGEQIRIKTEQNVEEPPLIPEPELPVLRDIKPDISEPVPKKAKTAMDDLFGDVFISKIEPGKNIDERINLEIKNYRAEPPISPSACPLKWWENNQYKYPLLSHVAKYLLAIPATSVASERVFSTAGDVVTAQRAALDSKNVDMIVFLKKNMKPSDLL